ncbi:DNA glycosylase [Lepidopterella palustris CBS 459.81]|uniref:DNA glycosylase n=1 Tax=Lepidopterella palustris CBS 459.81 TaxID=1314670 RepID=A0A8E2ECK3_9PEZI|nr:DNA glycosylase [Lepidopterella palustris CBS 459.81]
MPRRVTRAFIAAETAFINSHSSRETEPLQLSSPLATLVPAKRTARKRQIPKKEADEQPTVASTETKLVSPRTTRKRKWTGIKQEEDINKLPHNLGNPTLSLMNDETVNLTPTKKRKSHETAAAISHLEDVDALLTKVTTTTTLSKKPKSNTYGLTPGQTPYPNWPHPTPAECDEVTRLLSSVHGEVSPPNTISLPSLTVSGCGEVPSVLDALIRTRLSAATSGTNSSRAFAGLVSKFGFLKEGVGKGSVDWDAVRRANVKDIFEAIKSGGLADVKSKDIKNILQMVWEENQARRAALTGTTSAPAGASHEPQEKRNAEVARTEQNVLSLDHLHLLSNDDAFDALTKYPGIGPKTASCVLLFCLQRPSFAVDTHVFRLCKWLGWVPPPRDAAGLAPGSKGVFAGPTRNSTYAHCEVRVPDELKYPLHQLLIRHGKTCPRCRAATSEGSAGWEEGCVIEHLVTRSGGRKEGGGGDGTPANDRKTQSAKGAQGKKKKTVESEDTDSDLDDLGSEDELSDFES